MSKLFWCSFMMMALSSRAQGLDYNLYIQNKVPGCAIPDSAGLQAYRIQLENMPVDSFTRNLHVYHYDFGMCYYSLFLRTNDTSYLRSATRQFNQCLGLKPDYALPYSNNVICYGLLGECSKSRFALHNVKKYSRRKTWKSSKKDYHNLCP